MNRKLHKILLFFLVTLLMILPASAQDEEPVTLVLWQLTHNELEQEAINDVIAQYEAANPNVTIVIETRGTDEHKEAMRLAINTEAAPDIYFMWGGIGLGGFYVNAGGTEPLDDYFEELGWQDRFIPPAIDAAEFNGQLYGVPYVVHGMIMYYRTDLFEQAGITEEPQTYEDFTAAMDALVAEGITPITVGGKFGWHTMRLVDNLMETFCGAETHDQLKALEISWADEPCVTDTFVEFARWVEAGYLPDDFLGVDPIDSQIPMYTGDAAMMLEGDWLVNELIVNEVPLEDYGIFPFPTGTNRLYFFTEMQFITNTSDHVEEAVKFLDFFMSPEIQQQHVGTFGPVSAVQGVEPTEDQPALTNEWSELFNREWDGIFLPGDQALPLEITTEYWRVTDDIVAGVLDPTEAGAVMQTAIDNYEANN